MQQTLTTPTQRPAPRDDGRGRTLCGWRLRAFLGGGPLCASFFGERGREQAIVRVLRAPFSEAPLARAEWVRASWAANRFCHGRVLPVVQEGVDDRGAPVIVRRWAKGDSLDAVVRRGPLDVAIALRMIERLLDALEMAHAHGVAHGAITPSNLIVTPAGSVRLVDFAAPPGSRARRSAGADVLSRARGAAFAAPERRGDGATEATEQADIWSVGACLRFALTGAPPDDAVDPGEGLPTPATPDLAGTLRMALARDPQRRYDTAYAMLGDVRRLLAGRTPKLHAAAGPVPASLVGTPDTPSSSSGLRALDAVPSGVVPAPHGEWKGNLFLMLAIAVLVGLATFVVMREKLADGPDAVHEVR
jgi:serine/threonine-protein kinase